MSMHNLGPHFLEHQRKVDVGGMVENRYLGMQHCTHPFVSRFLMSVVNRYRSAIFG